MATFHFKHFSIHQDNSALKVGTDAMVLGALVKELTPTRILDIGTGTGVLSLMMAQKFPGAVIEGIDIDSESLKDCDLNFRTSIWSDRLACQLADFNEFTSNKCYDLIITNPPFYETSLPGEEPVIANAKHYLSIAEDLALKAKALLCPEGSFWVIFPNEYRQRWLAAFRAHSLFPSEITEIYGRRTGTIKRNVVEFTREPRICPTKKLIIRELNGSYSDQYIKLTLHFHAKSLLGRP